ncbi:unnamed protein product, partial [Iphiclides podalirius]
MPLILNKLDASPPARACLMLLEILGLDVDLRDVHLWSGAHRTPEYLTKNLTHTVPLLEDGEFYLSDSHAINTYLVTKYGGVLKDQLYPDDAQKRAAVDSRLFLDASSVFVRFQTAMRDVVYNGATGISDEHVNAFDEAYGYLDAYLQRGAYLAGDQLTLADVSAVATVAAMSGLVPVDAKHNRLNEWFAKLTKNEWYQKSAPGNAQLISFIQQMIKRNSRTP